MEWHWVEASTDAVVELLTIATLVTTSGSTVSPALTDLVLDLLDLFLWHLPAIHLADNWIVSGAVHTLLQLFENRVR